MVSDGEISPPLSPKKAGKHGTHPTVLDDLTPDQRAYLLSAAAAISSPPTVTASPPGNALVDIHTNFQPAEKLTAENYSIWAFKWRTKLTGYGLEHYVTRPLSARASTAEVHQGTLIFSALVDTISAEVIPYITDSADCYSLWTALAQMYAQTSRSIVMSLRDELAAFRKGSLSIFDYMHKIKSIVTKLATAGVILDADEVFYYVVRGLPSEFDATVAILKSYKRTISFQELLGELADVEHQLSRRSAQATSVMAHYTHRSGSGNGNGSSSKSSGQPGSGGSSKGPNQGKAKVTCQFCNKPGHHVKQCRKLFSIISTLKGSPFTGFGSGSSAQANVATKAASDNSSWLVDTGASHHLTDDLQNLSLHDPYDGHDEVQLGDGSSHRDAAGSG